MRCPGLEKLSFVPITMWLQPSRGESWDVAGKVLGSDLWDGVQCAGSLLRTILGTNTVRGREGHSSGQRMRSALASSGDALQLIWPWVSAYSGDGPTDLPTSITYRIWTALGKRVALGNQTAAEITPQEVESPSLKRILSVPPRLTRKIKNDHHDALKHVYFSACPIIA